jgi:CheY-like chemotaxis protein
MPEMDGIEATKIIRKSNSKLPIIALTANAISGMKEMFLENGFDDFLSKPIDLMKLDKILEKWIPKDKQIELKEEIKHKNSSAQKNISILSAFYNDGLQKTEEIKNCLKNEDYSLYITLVHGLKSASANAGYLELSQFAKKLEEAGISKNIEFIKAHNDEFLKVLETSLSETNKILSANKKESPDFETLKNELNKLKEAISGFDLNSMNLCLNALQEFTQADNYGASVSKILENTMTGEYETAISGIDKLSEEIQ